MNLVYLCHPLNGKGRPGEFENNLERITKIFRRILSDQIEYGGVSMYWGIVPIAPYLAYIKAANLPETDAVRNVVLQHDLAYVKKCDSLWILSDDISSGMQQEIETASCHGIKVYFKSHWAENIVANTSMECRG